MVARMGDVARKAVESPGLAPGDGRAREWVRGALRCARHLCPPGLANVRRERSVDRKVVGCVRPACGASHAPQGGMSDAISQWRRRVATPPQHRCWLRPAVCDRAVVTSELFDQDQPRPLHSSTCAISGAESSGAVDHCCRGMPAVTASNANTPVMRPGTNLAWTPVPHHS